MSTTGIKNQLKAQFKELVEKETKESNQIDWEKNKNEWLEQLQSLYKIIENAVAPFDIEVKKSPKTIVEQFIGAYEADELRLIIGQKVITFSPKGTLLIGTKGRVDVIYGNKIEKLVLIHKSVNSPKDQIKVSISPEENKKSEKKKKQASNASDFTWRLLSNSPNYTYEEINEGKILILIMDLIDG